MTNENANIKLVITNSSEINAKAGRRDSEMIVQGLVKNLKNSDDFL